MSFRAPTVFALACGTMIAACATTANAGIVVAFSEGSGLAGEAEFTLINPTTLQIRLSNTSTGVPLGFSNSDQILTSVAFDMGAIGDNLTDPDIVSGSVFTGPTSASINFDVFNVGANADVSGEWGFGNENNTGFLNNINFISSNNAHATAFGATNLDGPAGLDGPQGGIVANPSVVAMGGLGAIQHEVIATLTLSSALSDLSFLDRGITFEFGSDAVFVHTPAPGAIALLGLAAAFGRRRRRA